MARCNATVHPTTEDEERASRPATASARFRGRRTRAVSPIGHSGSKVHRRRLEPGVELVAQDLELAPLALVQASEAVDALVSEALSARPEWKEAQALVQVAQQTEKGAVYGPLIPTIVGQAFRGGLGGGKDGGPTSFGGSRDYLAAVGWRFGPGGLFDVGRIRSTRARREEARWNVEKLKDSIARQVVEARTRARSQQEQLETAKEALAAAEQGLELENILAEQDQTRARQDYARALGEYDQAQYALLRALGRLGKDGPTAEAGIARDSGRADPGWAP